jgi:hypothetical protein
MSLMTLVLAAAEEEVEPSKAPFYVMGLVAATWALVVSAIAIRRVEFPRDRRQQVLLMAITVVLVAAAAASAVLTG